MAQTYQLAVDDRRFLRELPQFFQSLESALAEVLQNAFRAQATHVAFHYDPDGHVLTITDDGVGAADPALLLTGARSG